MSVTAEMKKQYDQYLVQHIKGVKDAFKWLKDNLPEVLPTGKELDTLEKTIKAHDLSKYDDFEYESYAEYFYGKKTAEVKKNFNYAWLHHIHGNEHHWQYWMLQHDDEGLELLEMPECYVIEMICDWWSFSWKTGNLSEIFDWYKKHKSGILLHKKTKDLVEDILDKLSKKLTQIADDA